MKKRDFADETLDLSLDTFSDFGQSDISDITDFTSYSKGSNEYLDELMAEIEAKNRQIEELNNQLRQAQLTLKSCDEQMQVF